MYNNSSYQKEVKYLRGINKVTLLGNATRDTELRTTKSGKAVANMRLATNRLVKNADGTKDELTEYHTVICWGRLAETTAEYVVKGKPVYVEGRLATRTYKDAEGHEHERTEVIAADVQFLGTTQGKAKEPSVTSGQAEPVESEDVNPEEHPF